MGLIKLAVYGGIGYLVYQMFFADMPAGSSRPQQGRPRGGQAPEGAAENRGPVAASNPLTGSDPQGMEVATKDPSGTTTKHRVGRGVVR